MSPKGRPQSFSTSLKNADDEMLSYILSDTDDEARLITTKFQAFGGCLGMELNPSAMSKTSTIEE